MHPVNQLRLFLKNPDNNFFLEFLCEGGTKTLERLRAADEVLVSSATLLSMPVVSIDGHPVGGRRGAGPVGRELAAGLRETFDLSR